MTDETDTAVEPIEAIHITEIPAIRDNNENLIPLKQGDFPTSKEGKSAFFRYKSEVYVEKAEAVLRVETPEEKTVKKIAAMRAKLAKLEAELATDED